MTITFTLIENLETGETFVSPGILANRIDLLRDDAVNDNAWLNDTEMYLTYAYTAYRLVLSDTPEEKPMSNAMLRAFQSLIDLDERALFALAEESAKGCVTLLNPFWEDEPYTPSSTNGDYGPGNHGTLPA